jgi:hypothetical protein
MGSPCPQSRLSRERLDIQFGQFNSGRFRCLVNQILGFQIERVSERVVVTLAQEDSKCLLMQLCTWLTAVTDEAEGILRHVKTLDFIEEMT